MMADYLRVFQFEHCRALHIVKKIFWAKLPAKSYDLIFLDYRLPTTTGLEVLGKLSNRR